MERAGSPGRFRERGVVSTPAGGSNTTESERRILVRRDRRSRDPVSVSLVIVTYNNGRGLLKCLRSVEKQSVRSYEIVVVDNGNTGGHAENIGGNSLYLRLGRNYGLNVGRNIGCSRSRAEIVAFLDDDCVLDENYVRNSLDFLDRTGCYGFRGKIRCRTRSVYNQFQSHYDLGEEPFPYLINTEGNCVLRTRCLLEVGGWEESLDFAGGHEGLLLSFRLVSRYGREGLYYHPGAVIHHDFSDSFLKIIKKDLRHEAFYRRLVREHPVLEDFRRSYPIGRPPREEGSTSDPIWRSRVVRAAREQVLAHPAAKRFLYRYFYEGRARAFRGLCNDLAGRAGRERGTENP